MYAPVPLPAGSSGDLGRSSNHSDRDVWVNTGMVGFGVHGNLDLDIDSGERASVVTQ